MLKFLIKTLVRIPKVLLELNNNHIKKILYNNNEHYM